MFIFFTIFESPNTVGGVSRCIDNWQPRHNMKENFNNGTLKLNDEEAISLFSDKFIVEKELAKDYLHHLTNLERMKNIRADDRLKKQQNRRQKSRFPRRRLGYPLSYWRNTEATTSRDRKVSQPF